MRQQRKNLARGSPKTARKPTPVSEVELAATASLSPFSKSFPVVGLGASAGGLEALDEFFNNMPADSGMAFVVVTHQHPGHTSLLPELLRKSTSMPVSEVSAKDRVKPNSVYVARPEGYLGLLGGRLQLRDTDDDSSGIRLPINYFFRSLAEDQRENAVGIILSGTASDGAQGIKAIKAAMGITMAQEPESAKYPGMPRSAMATGLVDHVLPVGQLPKRLLDYAKGAYLASAGTEPPDTQLPEPMRKIVSLLRHRTGQDFTGYKPTTIRRRLLRRMDVHQIKDPQEYLSFLRDNPQELDLLFRELLVVVTAFFREPAHFEVLGQILAKNVLATRPMDATIRVWVPGCATGEEAYSIGMLLREGVEKSKKRFSFQIFATDLDSQAIAVARTGIYPAGIAEDVSRERLSRFFTKQDDHYRLKKEIREMVIFAQQNVIKDPPFNKMDLICCRNLLIYLDALCQKRVLTLFCNALKPDGLLFLGPSEGIGELGEHLVPLDRKAKIYRRTERLLTHPISTVRADEIPPTQTAEAEVPVSDRRLGPVMERLLLQRFVPASVIVNDRGDVSFIHGRTGKYLEPASGKPRLNVIEMAREGLRPALATALRLVTTKRGEVAQTGVRVKANGGTIMVDLTVNRLEEPQSVRGLFLITFQPSAVSIAPKSKSETGRSVRVPANRVAELEQEVQFTRESLQSTVEELQTTNEELKSSNEELQSTNEELQSTNEELETSKEEMQSLNEELQTVNAQLQSKVELSTQANDDLNNLLNGTAVATVFLDSNLKIRRYTEDAREVFNLIPGDIGRPLTDLASTLNYSQLVADADQVLRTLKPHEQEVSTRTGEWRLVRILPYRTTDNVIDGLVVTLVDITRLKQAERVAEQNRAYAENILATLREPLLVLDRDLRIVTANLAFLRCFHLPSAEVHGCLIYELGQRQWDIPRLRQLLERILKKNSAFEDFEVSHEFRDVGLRTLILNARRLEQNSNLPGRILLAMEDITEKRQAGADTKDGNAIR